MSKVDAYEAAGFWFVAIGSFAMGAIISGLMASSITNAAWIDSAIDADVGHYVQIGDTSETEFRWIEPASKQSEESEVRE